MEREAYIYHVVIRNGVNIDYDSYDSFVVVAKDSKQARKVCVENAAFEGIAVWLNPRLSSCRKLGYVHETQSRKPRVVVGSYNPG